MWGGLFWDWFIGTCWFGCFAGLLGWVFSGLSWFVVYYLVSFRLLNYYFLLFSLGACGFSGCDFGWFLCFRGDLSVDRG